MEILLVFAVLGVVSFGILLVSAAAALPSQRQHLDRTRRQAEERGLALLRSWLTPEQSEQFDLKQEFEVVGRDTGTRYRITAGTQMNVIQLDDGDRYVARLCFGPAGGLVTGDIMLAQKIALETMEIQALAVANYSRPRARR
jgi:hypothetical protein